MMADHDYKVGGLRYKYAVWKICPDCDGEGQVRRCSCRSVGDCPHFPIPCAMCGGKGVIEPDEGAAYFVLRLDEDPHARKAAMAYADSVEQENKQLADELRTTVRAISESARLTGGSIGQ